jgi:hypothetical protein
VFATIITLLGINGLSLGFLGSCCFSSVELSIAAIPVLLCPFMLFSGFLIDTEQIPTGMVMFEYISPFKYGFAALIQNEYHDRDLNVEVCGPNDADCVEYDPYDEFNFSQPLWLNMLILFFLIIIFRTIAAVALSAFVKKIGS